MMRCPVSVSARLSFCAAVSLSASVCRLYLYHISTPPAPAHIGAR